MSFTNITYTIIGDPNNTSSGQIVVNFQNDNPPTLLVWVDPNYPAVNLNNDTGFIVSGLSGGSYAFYLQDFATPSEQTQIITFFISTGTCVSITNVVNTTCGQNNGIIYASTSSVLGPQSYILYDSSNNSIDSNSIGVFSNLSSGLYYVIADDGGGVTGRSQNCLVKDSSPLEFDLYVVNNSSCTNNLGKIYVTNLNGTQPFTYTWSNGVTGVDFITGLTTNYYTLTVTDYYGCSLTKTAFVEFDPPIGTGILTVTQPTCFSADGIVNLTITGGTQPYYYSGSNGYSEISFLQQITFTGLPAGNFSIEVTDAGFCKFNTSTFLVTPSSFIVDNISLSPSRCGGTGGTITATILNNGSPATYTYQIFGPNSNLIETKNTGALSYTFSGLSSNTYTIQINDNVTSCVYLQTVNLVNNEPFNIVTNTTGTTCNLANGSIYVEVTQYLTNPLFPPFTISILGPNNITNSTIAASSTTFSFLQGGNYIVSVKDGLNCTKTTNVFIDNSINVDFVMIANPSVVPNQNSITTFITQGEPPFTINWVTNNVGGQTTASVNNLSAGTYTLQITDADNCVRTKSVLIEDVTFYSSSGNFTICNSSLGPVNYTKKGLLQMLMQGFDQLTPGGVGCIITSATFTAEVIVNGTSYTNLFHSTTNFSNVPTDNAWADTIRNLLLTVYGVGSVDINYANNTITIKTDCSLPGNILAGAVIKMNLLIDYGIACISSDACCGIISEDGNVPIAGPNYCIIVESGNAGIAGFQIVIETDY